MNQETYSKLEDFKMKTYGWHKTDAARDKLLELKQLLTPEEGRELSKVHADMRAGNTSAPFFGLMNNLILKYRQGPISGPAGKTLL